MSTLRSAMLVLALSFATAAPAALAQDACYAWPLRTVGGSVAYDGDTIYVEMPGLPPELAHMSVRVLGIDAPERGGRAGCAGERSLGLQARSRMIALLAGAEAVAFCNISWDKYGGRIDADVFADGLHIATVLVGEGLARWYDGGERQPWCADGVLIGE